MGGVALDARARRRARVAGQRAQGGAVGGELGADRAQAGGVGGGGLAALAQQRVGAEAGAPRGAEVVGGQVELAAQRVELLAAALARVVALRCARSAGGGEPRGERGALGAERGGAVVGVGAVRLGCGGGIGGAGCARRTGVGAAAGQRFVRAPARCGVGRGRRRRRAAVVVAGGGAGVAVADGERVERVAQRGVAGGEV